MSRHQEIRRVAPDLFIRAMFGGFVNQFGWGFFGFGMIFFWVFGSLVSFDDAFLLSKEVSRTTGKVVEIVNTRTSVNEKTVQKIRFSFVHPDQERTIAAETVPGSETDLIVAECYQTATSLKPGEKVEIEFAATNPEIARIVGTRRGAMPVWVILLVSIFPLTGLIFILFGIRRGYKIKALLNHSCLTYGVLTGKEPTNTRINKQRVMKLTFSFETQDGNTAYAVAKTHDYQHLVDEDEEPLLYNPFDPKDSCLLDDIPGRPRLDEYGCLKPRDNEGVFTTLLVPGIALLINAVAIILRFIFS